MVLIFVVRWNKNSNHKCIALVVGLITTSSPYGDLPLCECVYLHTHTHTSNSLQIYQIVLDIMLDLKATYKSYIQCNCYLYIEHSHGTNASYVS